ncbi:WhiB family transcriptional regulator [Streptomyces angustmyceticus]|uniref:WhiB family transcriptional regulator n=1 Tax=Streptomyces angustmyceticus TaxID=285578 RepID=UPI00344DE848
MTSTLTPETARQQLEDHRYWRYRGCAPDPDRPTRAQGNLDLSIDAWGAYTEEGGEERSVRNARLAAAVAVCGTCPVLDACRTYAMAEDSDGHLAEPEGVLGGMRSLERHALLIKQRAAAQPALLSADDPRLDEARTPQKQAVLVALARETDERLVAYRADMDVRTANWHRAILAGILGLDKETATRQQLLKTARQLGVLGPIPVKRDGRWRIAAAPNTDGSRQRRLAPDMPVVRISQPKPEAEQPAKKTHRRSRIRFVADLGVQLVFNGYEHLPRTWPTPEPAKPKTAPHGRHLRLVGPVVEQLPLPLAATTVLEPAA